MGYRDLAARQFIQAPTLALLLAAAPMLAAEPVECLYCPLPGGSTGEVRFGIGFIDQREPSAAFYNPWAQNGNYPLLWAALNERDAGNGYLVADVRLEGGDSAAFRAEGGHQGKYSLFIDYDRLTVLRSPGAQTPFITSGDTLTLPGSWVTGANTALMTDLANAVQPAALGATHENVAVGLSIDSGRWHYSTRLNQRKTQSRQPMGGMIGDTYPGAQIAILTVPQTHLTEDFEASAELVGNHATVLSFGYLGSRFSNNHSKITWQNPYDTAGISSGALALAPDNLFHQFYVQGRQRISGTSHASFRLAYSRYLQDNPFIPASTSASIALPRDSADAQINAWVGDLRYKNRISDVLGLEARYAYEDQSNETPRATYLNALGDTATTISAANEPYSFRKQRVSLSTDYRLRKDMRLDAGVSAGSHDRTYLEIDRSTETAAWLEYRWQPQAAPDLALRIEGQQRRVDEYQANVIENPLMRKYSIADRNAQRLSLRSHYLSQNGWDLGLQAGYATHHYPDSTLGLQDTREHTLQFDLGYPLAERLTLAGFIGWQGAETEQLGNDGVANWAATLRDNSLSGGVHLQWRSENERWEHSVGWNGLQYIGEISVAGTDYPDLEGITQQFKLISRYRYADDVDMELQFVQYIYTEKDWAREAIAPNSLSQVLGLGEGIADYRLWATYLTIRQRF